MILDGDEAIIIQATHPKCGLGMWFYLALLTREPYAYVIASSSLCRAHNHNMQGQSTYVNALSKQILGHLRAQQLHLH